MVTLPASHISYIAAAHRFTDAVRRFLVDWTECAAKAFGFHHGASQPIKLKLPMHGRMSIIVATTVGRCALMSWISYRVCKHDDSSAEDDGSALRLALWPLLKWRKQEITKRAQGNRTLFALQER